MAQKTNGMANKPAKRTFGLNMFMFFRLFISHLYAEMESRELKNTKIQLQEV